MPRSAIVASWLVLCAACGEGGAIAQRSAVLPPVAVDDAGPIADADSGPVDAGQPDAGEPDEDAGPQLACPWAIWDAGAFAMCGESQPSQSCVNGRSPLDPACCIWGDGGLDACLNEFDAPDSECVYGCWADAGVIFLNDAGGQPIDPSGWEADGGAQDVFIDLCLSNCEIYWQGLAWDTCFPLEVSCFELTTPQCCQ
jgi:hypothetical protein